MDQQSHPPHRPCDMQHCELNKEEVLERIAEKAAERAIEKLTTQIYLEIGKGLVRKMAYILGASALGLFLWLKSNGFIK